MRMTPREFDDLTKQRKIGFKENVTKPKPKPLDKFKSKIEREFASSGYLYVGLHLDEKILGVRYEPLRISLPGGSFKIDWVLETATGYLFVETKGSKRQKNYRDARSKLRAAAAIFSKWRFFEVRKEQGQWIVEEIHG